MPDIPDDVTTEYQLYFGGGDELDAATLGSVLLNTVALTEEANKEIGIGQSLEIKVKSNRKGSFIVDLAFISLNNAHALIPLITLDNIKLVKSSIEDIAKLVSGVLNLRKQLKDETPVKIENKGDEVVITTGSHNEIHVNEKTFNFYFNNDRAKQSVQEIFKALNNDNTVQDFSILDAEKNKLFEVERKEFPLLTNSLTASTDTKKIIRQKAQLNIVTLSFKTDNKWRFIFGGYPITAAITDAAFVKKVTEGIESFANGDSLDVELEIEQEFNQAANTYVNKRHTIIKVLKHIPRPKQIPLIPQENSG